LDEGLNYMNDLKKDTFESKALSHIPKDILDSMIKETKVDTEGMGGILDAVSKITPKSSPLPQKGDAPAKQYITVAIDSVPLKVSTDPVEGAMTLFAYLLATVWSKDKKVAKVLKAFNFSLQDANGQIIYPKQKGKKK
jgi:hypothetical protein